MKRSRHRWLGLTLFCLTLTLLALELPTASALKATSLIFNKSTSTTPVPNEEPTADEETQVETTAEGGETNSTNSKLTGIPQVDYVYDPNLPRELNGYNLSSYPFLATLPKPELIDFKCDGLHDGFYASVELKCQVYHHCIYGIRHDFLCANYTAFDQRTFICQFVSVVDCKNSPDFWSRNDALYKATTAKPTPTTTTTTTTTPRPTRPMRRRRPYYADDYYDDDYYYNQRDDYEYEERPRRPRPRNQGRPGSKKRPADEYDDERYDRRRPGTGRGRPAKRPYERRPYDEDEDRRPYRTGSRRPRPRDDEGEDKYEDDRSTGRDRDDRDDVKPRRPIDDDIRPVKRPIDDDRDIRPKRPIDDDRDLRPKRPIDDDRDLRPKRPIDDDQDIRPKRPIDDDRDLRPKRPIEDEVRPKRPIDEPREEIRPRKPIDDSDPEELKPLRPVNYNRPRKEYRPRSEKPVVIDDDDDYEADTELRVRDRDEVRPEKRIRDEIRPRDELRPRDREDVPESRPHNFRPRDERKPYNRDLEGPRLRGEDRYQSKGRASEDRPTREDRPRDDRPRPFRERTYEDVPEKKEITTVAGLVKPVGHGIFAQPRMPPKIKRPVPVNAKDKFEYVPVVTTTKAPKNYDDDYEDYEEEDTRRPSSSGKSSAIQQKPIETVEKEKFKPTRPHLGNKANRKPIDYDDEYYDEPPAKTPKVKEVRNRSKPADDYYYDYEEKTDRRRQKDSIETKVKGVRTNVRVVKRPFLPSRGGSPYLPRGLQPVAGRDVTAPINTTPKITSTSTTTEPSTTPSTTTTQASTTVKPTKITTQSTTYAKPEEEYEYYEEDEIDYDKTKESTTAFVETSTKPETTTYLRTTYPPKTVKTTATTSTTTTRPTTVRSTTPKPETTTFKTTTPEQQAKNVAAKVIRVYNENYEAIRDKLESTLSPGNYVKPYLATAKPAHEYQPKIQLHPEISKPYTATGKPFIPENISIKQNLADSIENDYDVAINEALAPKYSPRIPTGFAAPDRDYTFSRYRNLPEPQFSASEVSNYQVRQRQPTPAVSLKTPNSFFIHPQRMMFHDDINRYPRQLLYRSEYF